MTDLRRRTFGPHPTAQDWRTAPKADIEQALAADVIRRNPRLYAGHDADAVKFVRNTMGPTKWDLLLAAEAHGLAPQGTYLYPGERRRQPPTKTSALGGFPGRRAHAQKRAPNDDEIARAREISERRIAALIANGEDVRNTPAWRDALSESRMIDLLSRASTDPHVLPRRRIGIDRSQHTRVDIRWYAIPNQNKISGGFLPMIEEDGRPRGHTWASTGYDKTTAEAMAEEQAHEAASRFVGDWNVVVKKGRPPGNVPGRRAHAQKSVTLLKDMAPGLRGVAQRSVDAENRFLAYAMEHGDLSRAQAQRALTAFRKAHVIKFDAVNGTFHVKHGQFLDPDVLRRAAGLET